MHACAAAEQSDTFLHIPHVAFISGADVSHVQSGQSELVPEHCLVQSVCSLNLQ